MLTVMIRWTKGEACATCGPNATGRALPMIKVQQCRTLVRRQSGRHYASAGAIAVGTHYRRGASTRSATGARARSWPQPASTS